MFKDLESKANPVEPFKGVLLLPCLITLVSYGYLKTVKQMLCYVVHTGLHAEPNIFLVIPGMLYKLVNNISTKRHTFPPSGLAEAFGQQIVQDSVSGSPVYLLTIDF